MKNPAEQLEFLVESALAQKIYAVEFAWGFTVLERQLQSLLAFPCAEPLFRERLERCVGGLQGALALVRTFTEEADLGALDRGLAEARTWIFPFEELRALARQLDLPEWEERLVSEESPQRGWQRDWEATVHRHQGESRATFVCKKCGWELSYVQEVSSAEELEMPFDELTCPFCEPLLDVDPG